MWKEDENACEAWKGFVSLVERQLGCLHCLRAVWPSGPASPNIPSKFSVLEPQEPLVIPDSADITYNTKSS